MHHHIAQPISDRSHDPRSLLHEEGGAGESERWLQSRASLNSDTNIYHGLDSLCPPDFLWPSAGWGRSRWRRDQVVSKGFHGQAAEYCLPRISGFAAVKQLLVRLQLHMLQLVWKPRQTGKPHPNQSLFEPSPTPPGKKYIETPLKSSMLQLPGPQTLEVKRHQEDGEWELISDVSLASRLASGSEG